MTIESWLLLLESTLLIFTIVLLIYSIRDGRQREALLKEVGKATRVLTRQEYFFSIQESMLDAKRDIFGCITGRPPAGDEQTITSNIADTIRRMKAKGVRIRYVLPKFPDRLQIGIEYTKAGAEVFFSSCLMVHNLRYIVVDERMIVLGIPDSVGEKEATKKGYKIPSEGLATILKDYFEASACANQTNLRDYLLEVIEHSGATIEHLSQEFNLDKKSLKEILG